MTTAESPRQQPETATRLGPPVLTLAALSGRPAADLPADPDLAPLLTALQADPGGPVAARAGELGQAVAAGQRAASAGNLRLLAAYERLERLGRPLNAVAEAVPVSARADAGPLAGEPVAVKDIIAVAGVPTRCGSPASDPAPAPADAPVTARLRDAGADVFAVTQCLEYAAGFAHPEIGDTRNPRDPSKTSGGSSGGSAALVAAGVCALAVGTDTGGSIRIPAAYCGVVGLKPTYGAVPEAGVFPLSPSCDHVGTLTATVAGTARLFGVMAGQEQPALPAPRPYTLGVLSAQLDDSSVTPEVRAAVTGALGLLRDAGWDVHELHAPWLADLVAWGEDLAVIVAREAVEVHRGRDTSRYADGTRGLLQYGATVSENRYREALGNRARYIAAVDASLTGVDALAGPAVGFQAPAEDPPFGVGEDSGEGRFTGPYNLTGHPALSLPVPVTGLPAGLQLAGRRSGDWALLAVAAAAEAVLAR